ncbi:hypothetical protein LARV_03330 [Longilinea arvoryzae]|uniref:Molybdopterin cofactor biosynthesis MoaD-related C-terminal domain-containing protein n=1 Tax=Longilinea arvoryzae TaxID=360412 RepID=A0A0S7BK52_9CHLR|nr:DUF1952 domain-containing protein [Longilinea arvoryzae]GAP15540.1 hypothetical protein LARV_03330 [Longilinea arvoryzae]
MIETITRELRGLPEWVLREYFTKLGGLPQPDGSYAGDGWQARLIQQPDLKRGGMTFCVYRLEFSGEQDVLRVVWPQFELKILRPGG